MTEAHAPLQPTPSHTVGPFYGYALPFPGGGDIAPAGRGDTVTVHGNVYDVVLSGGRTGAPYILGLSRPAT